MCDKQRLNLYRLSRLLLEASTDTLRYFFEKLYSPQGDLQSFLKINRNKIKRLYRHNVITSDQKELLKPSNGTLPLLSELDITLLCILLTNLCHHQVGKPQCGWEGEPDDNDLSTGADILRLRKTRNKLYAHRTNAMMTDSDFQETWGKTCKVISRLSSHLDQKLQEDIQSNIEEISKAQVDPETMYKLFEILFNQTLWLILDRIGPQPDHTAPVDAYHDGDEEAETEMPKGYDGIICLIKLYPELKSNMTRPSLTAIAKRLLDKNMISEDEYEQLKDTTKPRRCLTDMLLKKILRLDLEKTELLKFVFNRLRSHHPAIATKISQIVVTEADRTAFRQVKQYGLVGTNAYVTSPNSYKMTDAEILFFERSLCENQECVDRINDELLSQFLISISDHSLINQSEKKISALFKMVQLHSLDVESVLEHILEQSMLEQWKMLRCVVPVRAALDQVMQDKGHEVKDMENTVVHIETAMGDAKVDDKMTNFCRFFLLVMDPGKLTLQSFLEKKYSAIGDLQQFLKSKEGELNILCSKCIIKQWQLDILLPATRDVPAVQNLDISTICILLIYLCQITKPLNGWKELPSNTDLSTGADILRLLHTTENLLFYRMAGGMNALEFNEKWGNIHGAISRLSDQLDEKAIDIKSRMILIRESSIDPGKERKINDEIFKSFLTQLGKNEEMKLGEIITMDVDEVCSDQSNQGYFRSLLGWMRYATNAVNIGFARQFRSDLKAVEKGSIVIKLLVWRDLKVELLTKDFVGKNLRRLIKKGCVESKIKLSGPVHVTVYILSPEAQGEKEEIHFHLELESIKHDVKKPRVHLKSQDMKLMVEEMDPIGLQSWIFDQLQIDLTKQKIMNEIVSWQDLSRCDQMEILLDSIKRLENGFDMLAQYCKENDPYVYNKVFEKQEQLASPEESDTDPKSVWSSYRKGGGLQKLYSMQLDLDVEEQGKLHQCVLNRCLPELKIALDVEAVCVFIQEKEMFDDVTMDHILDQETISDRIMELIRLIQQRDQDTYEEFKKCLVMANQSDLKCLLEKEEAQVLKEMKETHEAQGTDSDGPLAIALVTPSDSRASYIFQLMLDPGS
ncbi:hypothetical protein CHS0354_039791 [Potamilus streckersoni]|uniref:DZIP3-like HEPN domain-containing protein n=1 Tax=Potamilus streckersoni TaxID=2493646 RepID=A0AAE0VLK1_9BIVA|nr:hypothetical protein CHS0354_039791 [Potamilus streckersoni]